MFIQKPRGTKDLTGEELLKTEEICQIIKSIFLAYGYSEIQTPIFEQIEVFAHNDETLLKANKEFFMLQSRDSGDSEYVLRPENTASVARALVEHKLINKQVNYPLRYFYKGPFFRYERPQNGRFRQFTQMGIEKINSSAIEDDLENLLLVNDIQNKLQINLKLKLNYLGSQETKQKWNETLKDYFETYKEDLSPISKERIKDNPLRILDDKQDSQKEFVKQAPKIENYLSPQEQEDLRRIKDMISSMNIEVQWDPSLVRGIDYYTGLIYEWAEEEGLTVIAGGRYDELFSRFSYPKTPSLGLAIGIERLKTVVERTAKYDWKSNHKCLYLYNSTKMTTQDYQWINSLREFIYNNNYPIKCIVEYSIMSKEKHEKLAKKYKAQMIQIKNHKDKKFEDIIEQVHEV